MLTTFSRGGISHHLPGIVDAESIAPTPAQSAQVSHSHAIRTGDEGMVENTFSRERVSNHLSGIIDAMGLAPVPAQSAQVSHPHPTRTGDEGMEITIGTGIAFNAEHRIIDTASIAFTPAQSAQVDP